jgi:hypothetical protein
MKPGSPEWWLENSANKAAIVLGLEGAKRLKWHAHTILGEAHPSMPEGTVFAARLYENVPGPVLHAGDVVFRVTLEDYQGTSGPWVSVSCGDMIGDRKVIAGVILFDQHRGEFRGDDLVDVGPYGYVATEETIKSIRPMKPPTYRLGDICRPFWVRFNKPFGTVTAQDVHDGNEFLVVGYLPPTDELLIITPKARPEDVLVWAPGHELATWCLESLLCAEAEFSIKPNDKPAWPKSNFTFWTRIGKVWDPRIGGYVQLKPGDIAP